jgi:hypothetical protein
MGFWEAATGRFEGAGAAVTLAKLATAYPIAE